MAYYGNEKFYQQLKKDLMAWVWRNPKLLHKIKLHDLELLFEMNPQRGLSIDLRRFEPEYYKATFYPPEEKKQHIDEFVRKVCQVIHQNLMRSGRPDLTITITVRHMISEVSHWQTFYFDQHCKNDELKKLSKKETDWHYSFKKTI
ncbi:MAG: hypothetical protein AAGC65_25545 [Mucilaginibacter sp.]|uniref:hypothetical protein n=1 Tax=Mucilaginibacter sp. TaxID=1882438 RepID=UPI0031A74C41